MGADRAILVETNDPLDVIAVASVVAQVAKAEQADLIFCGGQQADWDSHALGAAAAEKLGWPQATWTSKLSVEAGQLTGTHDVDAGSETFRIALPAVVTTQQGLNEPRYPTLPNIMKAKRKELRRDTIGDLQRKPQAEDPRLEHPGQAAYADHPRRQERLRSGGSTTRPTSSQRSKGDLDDSDRGRTQRKAS